MELIIILGLLALVLFVTKAIDFTDFIEKISNYLTETPEERKKRKEYEKDVKELMNEMEEKEASAQQYELSVAELEAYRDKDCYPPPFYSKKDALFYVKSLEYYWRTGDSKKYESVLTEFKKYLSYTWRNNSTAYFTYEFNIYNYYYDKTHTRRGCGTFDIDSNREGNGKSWIQENVRNLRQEELRKTRFKK